MKKIKIFLAAIITVMFTSAAFSHDMWIAPENFSIKKGEVLKMSFPSDHKFPAADRVFVEKDTMTDTLVVTPKGKKIKLSNWEGDVLKSAKLSEAGTFVIASGKKGGFSTKTTDGKYEKKAKDEIKNPAKSTFSKKFTKAIVTVANPGGSSFSKPVGHELEIVPLNDPSLIKGGDSIDIKILLNGKPYETEIDATYDTFSAGKNVFAEKIKSGKEGIAKLKLSKSGAWLLRVSNKTPYIDQKKADEQSYTATLTFSIK